MRADYFRDLCVPTVPSASPPDRGRAKACNDGVVPTVPTVPTGSSNELSDDAPLAAKLRALGCPIALEIDGEVFCYLVADDEAAQQADLPGVVYTAAEAEVLAQFDKDGIHDLHRMKKTLGGTIGRDEVEL